MYMPRLSLYKPEKGKDYEFLDRQVLEMFTVGGTDMHVHKYLGPENSTDSNATADQPQYDRVKETNIQDLLFLENRDRKYDPDVYTIRGIYSVQDNDFNLSQFGMFLDNDTVFMTVHINSSVKTIGRKLMSGDVIELPHLKDEYALNDYSVALKRFYVIDDVNRASEGFSPTWYPHLYRLKLKQIVDSQEFKEILDLPASEDYPEDGTLRDILSTYEKDMQINDAVVAQAEADAPKSGYDTSHYYTVETTVERDDQGNVVGSSTEVQKVDNTNTSAPPSKSGYDGYLLGDDNLPNGASFGHGIQFPGAPSENDYFLRTDFLPKRMFRYDGSKWVKVHDSVRMTMSNTDNRQTQKGTFINNTNFVYNDKVASDLVVGAVGDTLLLTDINYPVDAKYVIVKYETLEKSYVISDYPNLITSYDSSKAAINLPVVAGVQDELEYEGQWTVSFYNNREEQRQGLSKVLRAQADN